MSNKKLRKTIDLVKEKAEDASTNRALLSSLSELRSYNAPIKFDHTLHIIISVASVLLLVLLIVILFFNDSYNLKQYLFHNQSYNFLVISFLIATAIFPMFLIHNNESSFESLSDYIFNKDKLQDNEMKYLGTSNSYTNELLKKFPSLFDKGNHSRKFNYLYSCPIGYIYKFEYVDSETRLVPVSTTMPDGKGGLKTTTTMQNKTYYTSYYRSGFVFRSNKFNPENTITAELSMLTNGKVLISGDLCCVETKDNLLRTKSKRSLGIESPEEFYKELRGHTEIESMNILNAIKNKMISNI